MTAIPTCREVLTFLGDYCAGELDPMRTSAFERHLQLCVSCRNYLDSYRRTIVLEREAFADPDLPDPPEELVEAILAIRRPG
ncbi:anti-sigma factor family protein [Longimicrobium sp.]|uniref:anti-sigma factor family protein n=1 Tax=Longimicrobium sp. TaxID=2029185 RepID=UPI002C1DC977|nr:zf-HC2 domain-containing protein [Longimicrobium sp.]HSU13343.1 zf-HC2 domain-containing protein [Longimicrobium sp.]